MLDGAMRRILDPGLNGAGAWLASRGVAANVITLMGLGSGLFAALMIAMGQAGLPVLLPLLLGRLADGLDGAVARASAKTDFGGYLDIVCDFLFYGAVPFAFILADTPTNAAAGGFLLLTFYVNGTTFLGYAILAERAGMATSDRGEKSLYFTAGLLEGTETVLFFALLALIPGWFAPLAWAFGALCLITAGARVMLAWRVFRD